MEIIIVLAIIILPISAVFYGICKGIFEPIVPDNQGNLEMNENGIYELRIL